MPDPRTDQIARMAARLLESGRYGRIDEAIRAAAEELGFHGVELPGHGLVRRHAGAMAMAALGDEAYAESVRRVLSVAERLMTALVESMPDVEPLLVGRAARGQIDGGVTLHIRLYTRVDVAQVAQRLVDFGYDEPGFDTVNTRYGRLNRLQVEDEGLKLVLTRCPPQMRRDAGSDLFTGRPVPALTLKDLRDALE
jgi:hypothetical protein